MNDRLQYGTLADELGFESDWAGFLRWADLEGDPPETDATISVDQAHQYRVTAAGFTDVGHAPGRLYGCPACEAACHCEPGTDPCVFDGDHHDVDAYPATA